MTDLIIPFLLLFAFPFGFVYVANQFSNEDDKRSAAAKSQLDSAKYLIKTKNGNYLTNKYKKLGGDIRFTSIGKYSYDTYKRQHYFWETVADIVCSDYTIINKASGEQQ
jgi:hypothetical protein